MSKKALHPSLGSPVRALPQFSRQLLEPQDLGMAQAPPASDQAVGQNSSTDIGMQVHALLYPGA